MQGTSVKNLSLESSEKQIKEYYEGLLSFIRSRLNVISTSVYLLQSESQEYSLERFKYLQKINEEIDSIRRLIND